MKQVIREVREGSIGEELGLERGDALIRIDGSEIEDVLDYYYLLEGESIELEILTKDGETVFCQVDKDEDEDLGLVFEEEFMGRYRHCANRCIFCFIDQLPKGLRSTLYFKDDDARLSFLSGNYITMTNMSQEDFDKIVRYRMSPINISIHTTDPELRVRMLKNPNASNLMPRLQMLKENGITMNGQIVLCKGFNDGENLDRTVRELAELRPEMQSVSIVPFGLTKFRDGLEKIEPFTGEEAAAVIDQIEPVQKRFYEETGMHFIHLSDEFYIMADRDIPEEERYDGYLQIENGVGMMRLFIDETEEAISQLDPSEDLCGHVSIVTGVSPSRYIKETCRKIEALYPKAKIDVHVIINHFFGETITVSGLLTGKDIVEQLKGKDLGDRLFLPQNLLKADEDILLDDMTLPGLEEALQVSISVVQSSGDAFVDGIVDALRENAHRS